MNKYFFPTYGLGKKSVNTTMRYNLMKLQTFLAMTASGACVVCAPGHIPVPHPTKPTN